MNTDIETANIPDQIKNGILSINEPEVQAAMKTLAKYNLGVFVPHKHHDETGAFEVLGKDEYQVEDGLEVSFHTYGNKPPAADIVEVGWRWIDDGIKASARCVMGCRIMGAELQHVVGHTKYNR